MNKTSLTNEPPLLHKHSVSKRFYFRPGDNERCYEVNCHLRYMIENNISEMDVFVAKKVTDANYMYCKYYDEIGDKGNCGNVCEKYSPKNGKSGACKNLGCLYEKTDKCFSLKIDSEMSASS